MLFAKIKFLRKFPDLQYHIVLIKYEERLNGRVVGSPVRASPEALLFCHVARQLILLALFSIGSTQQTPWHYSKMLTCVRVLTRSSDNVFCVHSSLTSFLRGMLCLVCSVLFSEVDIFCSLIRLILIEDVLKLFLFYLIRSERL